tara:strand:+ start:992 stop:1897 length:906 start_codon:yes stop_codon:yes gene_type:complete
MEEKNPVLEEIEKEIEVTKSKGNQDFEIEIADEPDQQEEKKEVESKTEDKTVDHDLSKRVQSRINKVVAQKKLAEDKALKQEQENAELRARLVKLEQGSQKQNDNAFKTRYDQTKQALHTAVEEGDTKAQVEFTEQLADMRAYARQQELQRQNQAQIQQQRPVAQPAQRQAPQPVPQKANEWWAKNDWFNKEGYERESTAARAIDVQLDLEGHDKNGDEYYNILTSRLQKMFPELISSDYVTESKPRAKSSIVAPSTGGSVYKGNRVRMTADELRMARELGINDEASLKKYAAEIQKSKRG